MGLWSRQTCRFYSGEESQPNLPLRGGVSVHRSVAHPFVMSGRANVQQQLPVDLYTHEPGRTHYNPCTHNRSPLAAAPISHTSHIRHTSPLWLVWYLAPSYGQLTLGLPLYIGV